MNYKIFLSGVFIVITCLTLHAEEEMISRIFYGNALVVGKENIYKEGDSSKQPHTANNRKKATGIKKETPEPKPAENDMTDRKSIILPGFPFAPSSSAFFRDGQESAAISPQQRQDKPLTAVKTFRGNTYPDIAGSDLSFYRPKQRQKLSPAATQCGMLTSFASNSPPVRRRTAPRAVAHGYKRISATRSYL